MGPRLPSLWLALTALLVAAPAVAAGDELDFSRAAAVVGGVLEWADPAFDDFDKDGRKDRALATVLRRRGVPQERLTVLLDRRATKRRFLDAVEAMGRATPENGWLIVYFTGHGIQLDDGQVAFALSDARDANIETTGLPLRDLQSRIIATLGCDTRCPKRRHRRVLLLGDACFSGGLAGVAAGLARAGIPAVALTSSDRRNDSTANWTYTQALIEILSGSPLADHDGDGHITLDEASAEVREALLFRERQRWGFSSAGVPASLELAQVARGRAAGLAKAPRGFPVGSYANIGDEVVRVLGMEGRQVRVAYFDYSERSTKRVRPRRLRPIHFQSFAVGRKLRVVWEGECTAAVVRRVDGPFHLVTFPGWEHGFDQWVLDHQVIRAGVRCPKPPQ